MPEVIPMSATDQLFTTLQTMNSSSGNAWTTAMYPVYDLALEGIEDELIFKLIKHMARHCKWRPSPAELIDMACEIASPIPTEVEVFNKIVNVCETGEGGHYLNSHIIVADVVQACGGWWHIAHGESKYLPKQVADAYKQISESWQQNVKDQLAIAPEFRDMKYFPERETTLKLETKKRMEITA